MPIGPSPTRFIRLLTNQLSIKLRTKVADGQCARQRSSLKGQTPAYRPRQGNACYLPVWRRSYPRRTCATISRVRLMLARGRNENSLSGRMEGWTRPGGYS
jgi:hypothetical protein